MLKRKEKRLVIQREDLEADIGLYSTSTTPGPVILDLNSPTVS